MKNENETWREYARTQNRAQKISFPEISILLALKVRRAQSHAKRRSRERKGKERKNERTSEKNEQSEKTHHQFGFEVSTLICLRVSKTESAHTLDKFWTNLISFCVEYYLVLKWIYSALMLNEMKKNKRWLLKLTVEIFEKMGINKARCVLYLKSAFDYLTAPIIILIIIDCQYDHGRIEHERTRVTPFSGAWVWIYMYVVSPS